MKIITDTGSDILEIEAKAMGVDLVPISANFEDVIFDRNTEENFKANGPCAFAPNPSLLRS